MPELPMPDQWKVDKNDNPLAGENGEHPYRVAMTFVDPKAAQAWLRWLMDNDPAWSKQEGNNGHQG